MLEWSSWPVNPLKLWVTFNAAVAKALQSCQTLCDPRRQQPTRLLCPWDSPGKNTGLGCHFLLQCVKVKGESEVAQSCPTLSDPMDCSLPGSSIHGILQARVLEWGAISFSRHLMSMCIFVREGLIIFIVIIKGVYLPKLLKIIHLDAERFKLFLILSSLGNRCLLN